MLLSSRLRDRHERQLAFDGEICNILPSLSPLVGTWLVYLVVSRRLPAAPFYKGAMPPFELTRIAAPSIRSCNDRQCASSTPPPIPYEAQGKGWRICDEPRKADSRRIQAERRQIPERVARLRLQEPQSSWFPLVVPLRATLPFRDNVRTTAAGTSTSRSLSQRRR